MGGAPSAGEVRQQVVQGVQQALTSNNGFAELKTLAQRGVDLAQKNADTLAAIQGGITDHPGAPMSWCLCQ